jgi:K+-sensing histidine kinase KdpD
MPGARARLVGGRRAATAGSDVALEATISADGNIPGALFDSFAENAIDNARAKAQREPGLAIRMRFEFTPGHAMLAVFDNGSAVPDAAAQRLFREPIERATGLGIGLYHTARLAAQAGYRLEIAANRDGDVCFMLAQDEAPAARSAAAE